MQKNPTLQAAFTTNSNLEHGYLPYRVSRVSSEKPYINLMTEISENFSVVRVILSISHQRFNCHPQNLNSVLFLAGKLHIEIKLSILCGVSSTCCLLWQLLVISINSLLECATFLGKLETFDHLNGYRINP